jgi:VCBS repeat-containing protein
MPNKDGIVEMKVQSEGAWVYQFTQEQLQRIKAMILGKSKHEAIALLLSTAGIQTVAVTFKNGNTIPVDPEKIHVVVLEMT